MYVYIDYFQEFKILGCSRICAQCHCLINNICAFFKCPLEKKCRDPRIVWSNWRTEPDLDHRWHSRQCDPTLHWQARRHENEEAKFDAKQRFIYFNQFKWHAASILALFATRYQPKRERKILIIRTPTALLLWKHFRAMPQYEEGHFSTVKYFLERII